MKCYNITLLIFITMIGRIMLHKKTLLFAALSAALWGGATQAADAAVVASLKPVGFIASAIADGVTETEVLLPDGASEHDYSLRPSDVKRLQNADLVVWVGPEMEAFMQKPVSKLPEAKQVTIAQLEDVKPLLMKSIHGDDDDHDHAEKSDEDHHHGDFNMHLWLSPEIARAQESVSAKAMSMLADKAIVSRLTYMDQDILNLILLGKVKFIDAKYNTQFSLNYELKKSFVCPINDETVLIHYVGPTKPWHYWAGYPSAQPFIKAKEASPWKNEPLMRPVNSNYARYCAKHNFKQNKPINGIMNYIYYFYLKIIK